MSVEAGKRAFIGIDLGGSNSYAALFDEHLEPLQDDKIATEAAGGYSHVISRLGKQIKRLNGIAREKGLETAAIGLAVPGVVDADGVVKFAPNLQWKEVKPLESLGLDIPTILLNDVNAGLLGELTGLEKPPRMTAAYFCGTGIGGAFAYEGRLIEGNDGGAGEFGHVIIKKGGKKTPRQLQGSLESYIGKWALNRKIRARLKSRSATVLRDLIDYDLKKQPVKSSSLKKAYKAGDSYTLTLMNRYYAGNLAVGISQAATMLQPGLVILGGGIMEAMGKKLLPHVQEALARYCMGEPPPLRLAQMGDMAGPLGAAGRAREYLESGGA